MKAIRNNQTGIVHLALNGFNYTYCGMIVSIQERIKAGTCLEVSLGRNTKHLRRQITCNTCLNRLGGGDE